MNLSENIRLWLKIGRGYTLPNSIMPYVLSVVLAAKHYKINYSLSLLGLFGVVLVHMSINMLDDYFDWKKGAVAEYKKLAEKGIIAISNKCFYLEQGLVNPQKVLIIALLYDVLASLIGLFIFTKVGVSVIIIAIITGILGFFYSAPPFRLSYYGLGEPIIGLIFGPMLMFGAYITAGAKIDATILCSSIILGLIVANIAHTHAIMDFEADKKVGKKSFPILFKTKDNAIIVQALMYILAYVVLAFGILIKIYPLMSAVVFIVVPKTFALVKLMKTQDRTKKNWMGRIPDWDKLQKEGADWFMLRLCLSINIVIDFVVLLGITYYLFG